MPTSDNTRPPDRPHPAATPSSARPTSPSSASAPRPDAARSRGAEGCRGFDPKAAAQEVPTRAVAVALTVASKAEAQYEELAKRGKDLYERVRTQQSTQDLLDQAGNTLSRTKGAVTTARKAADDTATAVRGTLGVGRREAGAVVETTGSAAESADRRPRRRSAKKTTTRARKNATATKSAAKGVRDQRDQDRVEGHECREGHGGARSATDVADVGRRRRTRRHDRRSGPRSEHTRIAGRCRAQGPPRGGTARASGRR